MAEAPNPHAMEQMFARKDEGPVTMLNLLKFKADGGMEKYMEYGAAVAPLLEKVHGKSTFMGLTQE